MRELQNLGAHELNVDLKNLYFDEVEKKLEDKLAEFENFWAAMLEDHEYETCLVEIKAGVGGEESSIFAKELGEYFGALSMKCRWKSNLFDETDQLLKLKFEGKGVHSMLLQEVGVHRVQRVSLTDNHGRIHTSTVSVAVLPYSEKNQVIVDKDDCDIKFMRSSGPGGQNANMANSAVRITHRPTGVSVNCQEYRSGHENLTLGLELLSRKINSMDTQAVFQQLNIQRKSQVGNSDRSEKIKTYNFIRDEVTCHTLNLKFNNLSKYFKGMYFLETSLFYKLDNLEAHLFKDKKRGEKQ